MNSGFPKVTVIVPNYNHAEYLEQRIESILAQTYQDFELILLDDCSTDNSKEILSKYRHHIKVSHLVFNEENSGTTFKQWARGIDLAKYEWIWIAESDDWCEPTLLQTLVAGITPGCSIAMCQSIAVRGDEILYINTVKHFYKTHKGYDYVRGNMLRITTISNASQAMFKKSAYSKIDKSFTTYKFSGDWLFWMLIAQHGDIYVSGKCLNYFRKHEKDVTSPSLVNGMAYREYIRTVATLQQYAVINEQERKELLVHKFNELLWDHRVAEPYIKEISRLYHQELGKYLVSLQAYRLLGKRSYLKVLKHKLQMGE